MNTRDTKIERLVPLAVAIAVVLVFLPALHNGFVAWDDPKNFLENDSYRGLAVPQLRWMWTTTLMGHYVPVSWMSLGLDYVLWGMNPAGYHLTNIVLHAANAALLYFIARRLLRATGHHAFREHPRRLTFAAATAALLFALHPLRVESVAWVTERRDVLSCLFLFASVLAYLRAIDPPRTRGSWYWLAVFLFVASVLSKATAMTLPLVLLVIDVYPLRRVGGEARWWSGVARRVYLEIVPFVVVGVSAAVISILVLHPPQQLSLAAKVAVSAYSLVFYLWKTAVPLRLSPLYEMPQQVNPLAARFLASYAAIAILGVFVWRVRRKLPGLAASAVAFVILTLPMLGIVQNGPQIAADRYTYFAAPALTMAVAEWLFSLQSVLNAALPIGIGAGLVALGGLTWNQTKVWHDSATLWAHVVRLDDSSSFGHVGLARLAYDQGDMESAVRHYERAVAIDPRYAEGFNNLGNALVRLGNTDRAIEEYEHALAINPAFAEAHNNLGSALARRGDIPRAIAEFQRALDIKPSYAEAHNNWGAALARAGDAASAIEHYQRAVEIDSTYVDGYTNWGNALVRLGRPALAERQYEAALRLRPDDADAHRNLGVALAQEGRMAAAADQFRRALELRPDDGELQAYLANAIKATRDRATPRP